MIFRRFQFLKSIFNIRFLVKAGFRRRNFRKLSMKKAAMLKIVSSQNPDFNLDEMIRRGVKEILATALEVEVSEYIEKSKSEIDENVHRKVLRNGYSKVRKGCDNGGQY